MNPYAIIRERQIFWPQLHSFAQEKLKDYIKVKAFGLPNCLGAKIELKSTLKIENWHLLAQVAELDNWILDMISYGFPLQFYGPALYNHYQGNHSSALHHQTHIDDYIRKELSEGAIAGPFNYPPFRQWQNISPLMTRPKSGSLKRRVIVDLSFPPGLGVNAFVQKGFVFGKWYKHSLPTPELAVDKARTLGLDVAMAVIDIERAYRNFRSDPLDWPLMVIQSKNQFYVDMALPFGARVSSLYVQRIADFVVRILANRGITSLMYMDDLCLLLPHTSAAQSLFSQALSIIRDLGLPINYNKVIPPTSQAIWLGVTFDFDSYTISVPDYKVRDLLAILSKYQTVMSVPLKEAQSVVGKIAHIAQVVPAARLFMCRLLDQVRDKDGDKVYFNPGVLSDFAWFRKFFSHHNAKTMMPDGTVACTIEADSSLVAGGAYAEGKCYTFEYPTRLKNNHNICQLEAINYLAAVRAFITPDHRGTLVEVIGDNAGAIAAISSGRAVDAVLASVARALWFHSAKLDVRLKFTHRPGIELYGADALSRAPMSQKFKLAAETFKRDNGLKTIRIYPAMCNYNKFI